MKLPEIRSLFKRTEFSDINYHFGDFILKQSGSHDPYLFLACALVSHRTEQGDVCLSLSDYSEKPNLKSVENQSVSIAGPPLPKWIESLQKSPVVGSPGEIKPLILDNETSTPRLYMLRYWQYENRLAEYIRQCCDQQPSNIDNELLESGLMRLFPSTGSEPDDQALAARTALENRFCVITGGPGTGKTTTVLKIIILLLEQAGDTSLELALAAPTGKAANRLRESIQSSLAQAGREGIATEKVLAKIPAETATIHRLLGSIKNSPRFRHDCHNPLPHDCVIVDEVSMVDLALMSKLVEALKPGCRLILLGDKNQLSSVESGSVLGDICAVPDPVTKKALKIAGSIVNLKKSYRFDEQSSIGRLASLINGGQAKEALEIMQDPSSANISWQQTPQPGEIRDALKSKLLTTYRSYFGNRTVGNAFRMLSQFSVICALRNGPYGAVALNRQIQQILVEEKFFPGDIEWYAGRPIMITRNDYHLELYNGDIGIALPDEENDGGLKIYFERGNQQFRKISPARLPEHETAFAMTIHKSQGSEFDRALIFLPNQDAPVLSRELIYTGITRARAAIDIWGDAGVLTKAVNRMTERSSGLQEALYG